MIYVIHRHIEKLAFGQLKLKIALHRPIGRTKRLVAKLSFCFELCLPTEQAGSNEPAPARPRAFRVPEKTLARSAKMAFRVASRHARSRRFGRK